jgi:lysophospholipase L1-like esterase
MISVGKVIHYLAFGDSLTVGYGAPPSQGFVPELKRKMEAIGRIPVTVSNAGSNGATTGRLLELILTEPELTHLFKRANVITITAGGNDLIQAALPLLQGGDISRLNSALHAYEDNYNKILALIDKIKGDATHTGSPFVLILIGLYNPFPQIPEAAYWVERFNLFLSNLQKPRIRIVQVYDAFKGKEAKLLYVDHIHPNAAGYLVIADRVLRAVPVRVIHDLV